MADVRSLCDDSGCQLVFDEVTAGFRFGPGGAHLNYGIAPDLADSFLRQGFAFVAMGNYTSAAREFRRGLIIRSDWRNSGFRLDQIYGGDPVLKTAHLESLAKAVEANPLDSELLMLMGLMLFFDGQAERSETFFAGAAQQGANSDHLLDHFLRQPGPTGAPRPGGPAKPGGKVF